MFHYYFSDQCTNIYYTISTTPWHSHSYFSSLINIYPLIPAIWDCSTCVQNLIDLFKKQDLFIHSFILSLLLILFLFMNKNHYLINLFVNVNCLFHNFHFASILFHPFYLQKDDYYARWVMVKYIRNLSQV